MAQDLINVGAVANDRTGDTWRDAMIKSNANFTELFDLQAAVGIKYISKESDFEDQTSTQINLEANHVHVITAAFSTAKKIVPQSGATWTSFNIFGPTVTYTGTGSMFEWSDGDFYIYDCKIDHPNAQGFDFTDTAGGTFLFVNKQVRTISGTKYGTFNNPQTVFIVGSSALSMTQGVTFTGSNIIVNSINQFFIGSTNTAFKFIDYGASISQTLELTDGIAVGGAGSIGIDGAALSANVPAGVIATVSGCNFNGVTTPATANLLNGVRWSFDGNSGIPDTFEDALLSLAGNVTETVIAAANTPVKVAGTWVCERESLFSCTTSGRATYNGERDITLPIDIVATVEAASGTNKDITIYLAINGTVIANSAKTNRVGSADPKNTTVLWQMTLSQNDYAEVFIENNTDTTNIIVKDAILRVR